MTRIHREIKHVIDAGALGRSKTYRALLYYLADASADGHLPKEIDIATDVLGRNNFDPAADSAVRVYVHKLRQKLDTYYDNLSGFDGERLSITKGKYQLRLSAVDNGPLAERHIPWRTLLVSLLLAIGAFAAGFLIGGNERRDLYANLPVWQAIIEDAQPVTILVGDYFLFSEGNDAAPGDRLIRDFAINNSADFETWIRANPGLAERFLDIHLSYLPVGAATALSHVFRVLYAAGKDVRVIPVSEFRAQIMRESHVIYVGYLSGLGPLDRYAFSASRMTLGNSYDELVDIETGAVYRSSAGIVTDQVTGYTDYGFLATFPGPAGNQFLFIMGTRDEGLMQMAAIAADPEQARSLGAKYNNAFEAVYRVSGMARSNVASTLLLDSPVDAEMIWLEP